MAKYPTKPTQRIKEALSELLEYNDRTKGRVPGEMYLGKDVFIVRLREPRVISGKWEDVERTMDIFDLMDAHQEEQKHKPLTQSAEKQKSSL